MARQCANVEPLHYPHCTGDEDHLTLMELTALQYPNAVNILQPASVHFSDETYPLHEAARLGHVDCVECLLSSGAQPDLLDCRLFTATLHTLSSKKNPKERLEIISLLLDHGAELNYPHNSRNMTRYVEQAAQVKQNEILRLFLEREALTADVITLNSGDLQCRTNFDTPLCVAIQHKNTEALSLLLYHGAPTKFYDFNNQIVSIPHRMIEVYYKVEQLKEALRIYVEYGGSMWTTFHGQNALQAVNMPENGYYFNVSINQVKEILTELMGTPRSLQSLCRTVIHQQIGRLYWQRVYNLPLPTQIISYLLFPDCKPSTTLSVNDDVIIVE